MVEKKIQIGLAVLIQYRSVTASHPASHVAVAITLNAKASSLKTNAIGKVIIGRTELKSVATVNCSLSSLLDSRLDSLDTVPIEIRF